MEKKNTETIANERLNLHRTRRIICKHVTARGGDLNENLYVRISLAASGHIVGKCMFIFFKENDIPTVI